LFPFLKQRTNSSVKQNVDKFLRRVQLKVIFHEKEDDSNTSNNNTFETLLTRKSKWTPPPRYNKPNFNRSTKISHLSSEEWSALQSLRKRKDIVVKAADKGGALVVWGTALYQKEALRQLSDTSSYQKVEKDLTSIDQNTVKKYD